MLSGGLMEVALLGAGSLAWWPGKFYYWQGVPDRNREREGVGRAKELMSCF